MSETASTNTALAGARAALLDRRLVRDAGELLLVALAFLLYFVVRGHVIDREALALGHARDIVRLERDLGVFHEPSWQADIADSRLLIRFFNFVYFWLDFPLIAVLGLTMYFYRRQQYTFTRDALLFSGAIALVIYQFYPVAPPRLLPEIGVVDMLQQYSNLSYQAQSTSFFVNPYAAVPSLHVGWSFLVAIGVLAAFGRYPWVWPLALLHPITQSASTVFTGNHFFFDGAVGLAVATAGLTLALSMQRWGYPSPAPRRAASAVVYIVEVTLIDKLRGMLSLPKPFVPNEPAVYRPIGVVRNPVKQPRVSGWQDVRSDLFFAEELADALDGLDGFSHVIVVFHLDRIPDDEPRPSRLRPGNIAALPEVGVLATRSPLRPNPIGIAVVRIVHRRKNVLRVRGLDALDGTPILDIKPYLPPYDAVPDAKMPDWAIS